MFENKPKVSKLHSLEFKGKMNSENACYHSVQSYFFQFLIQIMNLKMYRTIILPAVLYGCKTCFLT